MGNARISIRIRKVSIGDAVVSTDEETLDLRRAALHSAGDRQIFEERPSGAARDRREPARILDRLREDAAMEIPRPGHLTRSARDL